MKIILVTIHVEKSPPAFPLAAAVLQTALDADPGTSGFDTESVEYYLPVNTREIAAYLSESGAAAAGFTASTWNSAEIISICKEIRRLKSVTVLFVGGPQATAAPETFAETDLFDFIVAGEGEEVISKALMNPPPKRSTVINAPYADFSGGATPYRILNQRGGRTAGVLWEISRGCPYSCSFCYESRGCRTIRTIPHERIRAELEIFKKNKIEKIWVLDPTFNRSETHAETVLTEILKIYPDARYTFEIRAELMTEKLCRLISQIDASLQIGLQTTNPAGLEAVNRSLNRDIFLKKCRMMSRWGLGFGIDLIYGLPGDNFDSFRRSVDFAVEAAPNNIDIFPLSVLPGTEISDKAEKYGIRHSGFPHYTIYENISFSREDMKKAAELTAACDMLYNREQSFAWFKTAADALEKSPSGMFALFSRSSRKDPLAFIKDELRRSGKEQLLPVIESFVAWSRTAEAAFSNPGKSYQINLCRKPEVLDELASGVDPRTFLKRHPSGKNRKYSVYFDGEDLFIN